MQHNERWLVIGGLPNKKRKLGYGGATVLMQNFVDFLKEKEVDFKFVQTNRYFKQDNTPASFKNKLIFFFEFIRQLPWAKCVIFNFSDHATVSLYPFLARLTKKLGKQVVLRKFGGSLELYLSKHPKEKQQYIFQSIDKADLILLETKVGMEYVSQYINSSKLVWLPNVRKHSRFQALERYEKRFVFISHILDEKGVGDILSVAETLPEGYIIDFYGPIKEVKYKDFNWEAYHVQYKGILTSEEVLATLSQYNILLLTSYREGYPGIIIEAMSVGIPTITTTVGGIPEIVKDKYNGLLVEAGNIKQIKEAMYSVNQENYQEMSRNTQRMFTDNFESEATNRRIVNEFQRYNEHTTHLSYTKAFAPDASSVSSVVSLEEASICGDGNTERLVLQDFISRTNHPRTLL